MGYSCAQLVLAWTVGYSCAQLVLACTVGYSCAQLVLAWRESSTCTFFGASVTTVCLFFFVIGRVLTRLDWTVGYSCAQLVLACKAGTPRASLVLGWFSHAQRAHHTPLLGSVRSHAQRAHQMPLSRPVGSRLHSGHTKRHFFSLLIFACTPIPFLLLRTAPQTQ